MGVPSSAIGQFVIGQSPIQGSIGAPQTITKTIKAYLYQQYVGDPDLQPFIDAYNELSQEYLDWYNETALPIYTGLSGSLLDWVGAGLYGFPRPTLSSGTSRDMGPYNTAAYNTLPYDGRATISSVNYVVTTDDIYKRCLTWNFFKGDGYYFTTLWLKRRIMRFLTGVDGTANFFDQTYEVSVRFTAPTEVVVLINGSGALDPNVFSALQEGIASGVLQTPFQFNFNLEGSGFGYFAFGISAF